MTHDEKIVEALEPRMNDLNERALLGAATAALNARRAANGWPPTSLDKMLTADREAWIEDVRAAITAYQAEAWQDISTAPKDGSEILITDGQWAGAGFYHDGTGCKRSDGGWFCEEDRNNLLIARDVPAKFWQPLPNPPASP